MWVLKVLIQVLAKFEQTEHVKSLTKSRICSLKIVKS